MRVLLPDPAGDNNNNKPSKKMSRDRSDEMGEEAAGLEGEGRTKVISVQSDDSGRRVRVKRETLSIRLVMSIPADGEECCIGLEPIAEYRMDWFPPSVAACMIVDEPLMTKATIAGCGHSFNALALLYHFVKNEMTCPCCRHGHSKKRMSMQSVPPHIREVMEYQVEKSLREERDQEAASDTLSIMSMIESEVTPAMFLRFVQASLILYAYVGADSLAPMLVQEIRLESSFLEGILRLSSYTYNLHEIGRNMRLLNIPLSSFELVAVIRQTNGEMAELVRSQRFSLADGRNTIPCVGGSESGGGISLTAYASPLNAIGGRGFEHIVLLMPSSELRQFFRPNGM